MSAQRGFTLLEALIAIAIASAFVLGISGAVLASLHAAARAADVSVLQDRAANVLSDLRESTAYDAGALAAIEGKTQSSPFSSDSGAGTMTIAVSRPAAAGDAVIATVTIADATGASITERRTLFVEAPAPGSIVDQPSPAPSGPTP